MSNTLMNMHEVSIRDNKIQRKLDSVSDSTESVSEINFTNQTGRSKKRTRPGGPHW